MEGPNAQFVTPSVVYNEKVALAATSLSMKIPTFGLAVKVLEPSEVVKVTPPPRRSVPLSV
jgi:hypothetical protein